MNSNLVRCYSLDIMALTPSMFLLQVNSVSDERISATKLIENNNVLKQIAELNKSECVELSEENKETLSTLASKFDELLAEEIPF